MTERHLHTMTDRTTIVAIAKDDAVRRAFIFNTSAELRSSSNKYKELLDFFEINIEVIRGIITINEDFSIGDFHYKILEELPYSNYNHEDQKEINKVKKKYIEEYNKSREYILYNLTLNDKAKEKEMTRVHNGNIIKWYEELHYKRLQKFYDDLFELCKYDLVKSYLNNKENLFSKEISNSELSKMYFNGNKNAGIELLLRKRKDELINRIVFANEKKADDLCNDFDSLLKVYKTILGIEHIDINEFDFFLSFHILKESDLNRTTTLLVSKALPTIKKYFESRKDTDLIKIKETLNTQYSDLREATKEDLFYNYIIEKNDTFLKKIYLYTLYEKLQDLY